ncbi:MAG: hypothetical protein FWH37_06875 [Candidatus Bathyarchaeota archaeon]|nr:hypothetical protein [Candidatus Termiticorpusculum sp.]
MAIALPNTERQNGTTAYEKHQNSKSVYEPEAQDQRVTRLRLNCKNSKLLTLRLEVREIPQEQKLTDARTNNPTTTNVKGGCNHLVVPTCTKHAKEPVEA